MQTDPHAARPLPVVILVVFFALSCAAYLWRLDSAPVYLGGDEAHFAVHGYAIGQDGRNLDGMRLPLFVNLFDPAGDQQPRDLKTRWYQPMLFYIVALDMQLLPLNEFTLRLPTALVAGLVVPLLTFFVALRLFNRQAPAALAALLAAASPTMLILGRQALDYVLPLPFVLGWLWWLLSYRDSGRTRDAALAGLCLGAGFYSYIAAWIFMPICLALSWIVLWQWRPDDARRACIATTAAFAAPLIPLLPWFIAHPEMLRDTLSRYKPTVAYQALTYLSLFDPRVLFVDGGPVPTTSLGRSGAMLVPVAVLLPAGIYALLRDPRCRSVATLLLAGTLLAPVPAAFAGEIGMIQRSLMFLVFVAFVCAAGAMLIDRLRPALRTPLWLAIVAACVVQFGYVYFDYFTHYKLRSAFYYDSTAFIHVAEDLVEDADIPLVLLSRDLDDAGSKWRFYVTKHGRTDLLARTRYVDPGDVPRLDAPAGSVFVTLQDQRTIDALRASGTWRLRKDVLDIDNRPASMIFERVGQ